jgi:hypothetical protein
MAQQQVTGQVGSQGPVASGASGAPLRQGNFGDLIVTELNPQFYEQSLRGNVFCAAQVSATAAIALTTGGATFTLSNPLNSGVNLALIDLIITTEAQTAATQLMSFQLGGAVMGATQTYTTKINAYSNVVTGVAAAPKGIPAVSTSFSGTAVAVRYIGSLVQAATATSGVPTVTSFKDQINGAIVIPPGSYVGIYGLTGGTVGDASIAASITWAEIPNTVL